MSSVVQNILDKTVGDGARSTKFECFINFQAPIFDNEEEMIHLVKTSQFPGKSHDVIDLKYKGRTIPIKGQVKYDNTWTCTFYLTQDHLLKKSFEDWIEAIDQVHNMSSKLNSNVQSAQVFHGNNGYTSIMQIAQMDFHGSQQTAKYTMFNVFPKSVSAVDVDYSAVGTILELTVEFSYSHYEVEVDKTDLGSFADEIKATANGAISNAVGAAQSALSSFFTSAVNDIGSLLSSGVFSEASAVESDTIDNMVSKLL